MKKEKTSLEAINFQASSRLGTRLTMVFQKVIDFVNIQEPKFNLSNLDENIEFLNILENYSKKLLESNLYDIVKDETGIILKNIVYISPKESCGIFAINIMNDNESVTNLLNEIISGNIDSSSIDRNLKINIEELLEVGKTLDLKTGYLDLNKTKVRLTGILYFDIATAFAADLCSISYKKSDRFKAEEIAAIIMHEIGHIISTIEYIAYNGYCGTHGTQFINKKATEINDPKKFVKELAISEVVKYERKIIEKVKDEKIVTGLKNLLLMTFDKVTKIGANLFIMIVNAFMIFAIIKIMFIFNFAITIISIVQIIPSNKTSREAKSDRDVFLSERLADEYVSRCGFGSYLSEGLRKIQLFFSNPLYTTQSSFFSNAIRSSFLTRTYLCFTNAIMVGLAGNWAKLISSSYEKDYDRLNRILENSMAIFKKAHLPAQIRDRYIVDTERILYTIKQQKKDSKGIFKVISKSITFVLSIVYIPILLVKVLAGDISKSQTKLINDVDSLMNNKLYYLSAKLKQKSEYKS